MLNLNHSIIQIQIVFLLFDQLLNRFMTLSERFDKVIECMKLLVQRHIFFISHPAVVHFLLHIVSGLDKSTKSYLSIFQEKPKNRIFCVLPASSAIEYCLTSLTLPTLFTEKYLIVI